MQPENIMLVRPGIDSDIKLIDLGLAEECKPGTMLQHYVGTPYYIAPEVLKRSYNHTADVWSLGIILYALMCAEPPFGGDSERRIYRRILSEQVPFASEFWVLRSSHVQSLVYRILTKNPDNRPSVDSILCDPWIVREGQFPSERMGEHSLDFAIFYARLRRYCVFSQFKRFVLLHIAHKYLVNEINTLYERKLFLTLDHDRDDCISANDLRRFFQSRDVFLPMEDYQWMAEQVTMRTDKDACILFPELVAIVMPRILYLRESSMLHEFAYFDRDSDGFISVDDFSKATSLPKHKALVILEECHLGQSVRGIDMPTFVKLVCGGERNPW